MTETLTKEMAHSYSRLQVYSQCPLSYKLQYLDKKPSESNDALEIGAAAHEFFDQWVKLHGKESPHGDIYYKRGDGDKLIKITKDEFILDVASNCFQKEPRSQSNFKDYLEICRTFAKAYKPDPNYPIVTAERQAAFSREWKECAWFDPKVYFRAKIDRIDTPNINPGEGIKKIRVVDYKTGFAGSMDSFQLDVYALVSSLLYPSLKQVEVEFYYVKSGFKQTKLLQVEDMGITKVQLEALMARIESEQKWKAKPGVRCLNCSVAAYCTAKPSGLKAITSLEVAQTLGTEIAFLEAQAKAKKKALNAWCKEHGAVEAGGLLYKHWATESIVVQIAPLLSLCVAHNIDPGDILNPDSTAFKKVCRQNPAFAEAISPYTGIDTGMRFYGKRNDSDE